ncbi:MAG TPA: hypothetical protein VGC34_10065, partial [Steroidobacteraceae bacterium]
LGSAVVHFGGEAEAAREASGKLWRAVSVSTDFAATGPIPAFPPEQAGNPTEWMIERLKAAANARTGESGKRA